MSEVTNAVQRINALTQEQRESALDAARKRIAGVQPQRPQEPTLDDFMRYTSGRFPPRIVRLISGLSAFMLVVAFLPSAMRLHQIGKDTFAHAIADSTSIYVAALCIVLMAEVGQVIFSLAAATTAQSRMQRIGLGIGATVCTCIALAGNAEVVSPWNYPGAFVWLETFAPPVLVLITAQILKTQMLHSIEARHEAQRTFAAAHSAWNTDYADALRAWQSAYDHAHEHASWMRVQANALRDALRKANARSSAMLRDLTDGDWRTLILREVAADAWYERAEQRAIEVQRIEQERMEQERINQERTAAEARRIVRVERSENAHPAAHGASGGERTGATDGNVREVDGAFIGVCPDCGAEFTKPTYSGAVNALSAHMGRWCPVRKANALQPAAINGIGDAQ